MTDETVEYLEVLFVAGTTPLFEVSLQDENGEGFKPSELLLTVYDPTSGEVLRPEEDVTDLCDSDGHVSVWLTSTDTSILSTTTLSGTRQQQRRVLLQWTWDTDKVQIKEYEFSVRSNTL